MNNLFRATIFLATILAFSNPSDACSPVQIPTLTGQAIVGCNLNLNWSGNTIYPCQYYIQVELACNGNSFTGTGNPPYYVSATVNQSAPPYPYPLQSINICALCPGTTYKFRAREVYAASPTIFSGWTATFTFTTPGTFVQPTLTVTASPNLICIPQTSQLNCTIQNACGPTAPTYSWVPAGTLNNPTIANPIATPTGTTTYTVYVTGGALGCWSANGTVTITATVPPIAGTASVAPSTICAGSTVTLSLTGYTGTIQWQSGPTSTGPWTNIVGGTTTPYVTAPLSVNTCFQAVVTGCGNVTSNAVCVTVNPAPIANAGANVSFCTGGSAQLNGSGGGSYVWTPSGSLSNSTISNPIATPTVTTTYTLTVTQAGCSSTATVTVTVNPVQTLTTTVVNPVCSQGCNGTITANPVGGNAPYTYLWSPSGQTGQTATGLCAGTYSVVVTSVNGCTATISATIVQSAPLNASIASFTDVTCFNACNGTATVNISGGTAPYSYVWAPSGGTNQTGTGLCAGTYTITITDANGCTGVTNQTIAQPTQVTLSVAGFSTPCNGTCSGQGVVIPSGGVGPYSFSWAPSGGTNPSATGLCAGIYTVYVTDANGCTKNDTAIVNQPTAITMTTATTAATCNLPNGSATVNPSGGVGPYSYSWAPSGGNAATANNLLPATYTVFITDANGCTANTTVAVQNTNGPTVSIASSVNPNCFGSCNGTSTAAGAGGVPPYNYAWAPSGGNAITGTGLCAGTTYTCTITDANGCTNTITVTLTQPTQLTVVAGPPVTICNGQNTTLTANGNGGTPTYTYSWAPAGPNVNPTVTTQYTVFITDANGCTGAPQTVTVTVNPPLTVNAPPPASVCLGSSTTLIANGFGGNGGPYTYAWTPGNLTGQSITVSPTVTTTYTVAIADNCGTPIDTATVTVTVNPSPVVSFTGIDTVGCAPLTVTFTNNTTNSINCSWNFGDNGTSTSCGNPVTYTYTTPGTYTVSLTITDNNGCIATSTHPNMINVIGTPTSCFTLGPQPTTILNPTIQFNDCSIGAATWSWSFGDVSNSFSTLQNPQFTYTDTGTYSVWQYVCNNTGCCDSSMETVVIGPDFTLYVPNAFTPNGDGLNETFFPQGTGLKEETYKLWVFDRWGGLIFYTEKWNKSWDGHANGGDNLAQEDVYVWRIEVLDYTDKKHKYVGHVSLIR